MIHTNKPPPPFWKKKKEPRTDKVDCIFLVHINILIKYKRKCPGRVQQTGTGRWGGGGYKRKSRPCPKTIPISASFITSVQIRHSLCIKVTLNNSGSTSIIQCLLLYGLNIVQVPPRVIVGSREINAAQRHESAAWTWMVELWMNVK